MLWIMVGLASLVLSAQLAYAFTFELTIDKHEVYLKFKFVSIAYRKIQYDTKQLIIDHQDAKHLKLISKRKDYYSEDVKNNLRFSFITPWD